MTDFDMVITVGIFPGKVIIIEPGNRPAIHPFLFQPHFFANWPISAPGGGMTCSFR